MATAPITSAFPWMADPTIAKVRNRPYTGNRTERLELYVSASDKARWARHASACGVTLPFLIHTAMERAALELAEWEANHTGMITSDPLLADPQKA